MKPVVIKKNSIVSQSDEFINSILRGVSKKAFNLYKYTSIVMNRSLSELLKNNISADDITGVFSFPLSDFKTWQGVSDNNHKFLTEMKDISAELLKTPLSLLDDDGRTLHQMNLYSRFDYFVDKSDTSLINVVFKVEKELLVAYCPDLIPFLPDLFMSRRNHHEINIDVFAHLTNKYAGIFYEMLNGVAQKNIYRTKNGSYECIKTLDFLKAKIGLQHKSSYNYGSINKHILTKCQFEINNKSDLFFDYKPVYQGKKVVAVKFYNIQRKNASSNNNDSNEDEFFDYTSSLGFKPADVLKLYAISGGNIDFIKETAESYNFMLLIGNIDIDKLSYFIKAINIIKNKH